MHLCADISAEFHAKFDKRSIYYWGRATECLVHECLVTEPSSWMPINWMPIKLNAYALNAY